MERPVAARLMLASKGSYAGIDASCDLVKIR